MTGGGRGEGNISPDPEILSVQTGTAGQQKGGKVLVVFFSIFFFFFGRLYFSHTV